MAAKFRKVFGNTKPVIAMVHIGALPGSPLYDADGGLDRLIADARKDLTCLNNHTWSNTISCAYSNNLCLYSTRN